MNASQYYKRVADYFDKDAGDFDRRYELNPVLKTLRSEFRKTTEQYSFHSALEIGCGTGIDLCYFGIKYPDRKFYGIDISPEMVRFARDKIRSNHLQNTSVDTGNVEDVQELFPDQRFDMAYVYFGALNTVHDLEEAAINLSNLMKPGGKMVLTVVNRYYLLDLPLFLLRGDVKRSLERVTNRWQGYSSAKSLGSRCYSSRDMQRAFSSHFRLIGKRGYCIVYPAWYRDGLLKRLGKWGEWCWKIDVLINKTVFWNTGEYSLYVYDKL